ncbi:MAG TPA: MFS transporter [Pirellulaceae bacterium]|nr:MFS transporter [Pirellulaceae bacterium]
MTLAAGSPAPEVEEPRGWHKRLGGALTHRNFRILWIAALVSTIGTWMQGFAQSYLIYSLTASNFYLGLDSFLGQLPILLFMLIGGVVADRHDRRRLLTTSQYIQAASALSLAALVATGHVSIAAIFMLSFMSGCGQAFGGPAYQAMIPSLVPRRDLPNAIALNSTQFNLSRVLGPVAGAVVLSWIGVVWCFTLNGLSFFVVIVALTMLHLAAHVPQVNPRRIREELRSGLRYVRESSVISTLAVLAFVTTFLAAPTSTFFPAFATSVLKSDQTPAQRLSMLMAAQGLGAIVGALIIGSLGRFRHMGRALLGGQIVLGIFVAAFAASRSLPLSVLLVFIYGICSMAVFSMSFSLVQLTAPDELRGRIVSIYMVALRGGFPLGGLVAGAFADRFGAPRVMMVSAGLLAVMAATLLIRRHSTLFQL